MTVEVVQYSSADLDAVVADIDTRSASSDPVLQPVVGVWIDTVRNKVVIESAPVTAELQTNINSSYGGKAVAVEGEVVEEANGPFDDDRSHHFGGMALEVVKPNGTVGNCTMPRSLS